MNHPQFVTKVLEWYRINGRKLPWRATQDPYKIWLSEIILQQTRVDQGLPYYEAFVKRFPNVQSLAAADEQEVLNLWQGLGYYSRARNLHASAKMVCEVYDGVFPDTYLELKKLKGVGDYTAAAIASFAYREAVPAIDGNVYRVLSRYFDIDTPIDSSQGKKQFKELSQSLVSSEYPDDYNQAMMEMGAMVCTPKKPNCDQCPVENSCALRFDERKVNYPFKSKKVKVSKRVFHYMVSDSEYGIFLHKRSSDKDIWRNLYEFPLIESELLNKDNLEELLKQHFGPLSTLHAHKGVVEHKLSHQHLTVHFWKADLVGLDSRVYQKVSWEKLVDYPVPRVVEQHLNQLLPEEHLLMT